MKCTHALVKYTLTLGSVLWSYPFSMKLNISSRLQDIQASARLIYSKSQYSEKNWIKIILTPLHNASKNVMKASRDVNAFLATVLVLHPMNTPENQRFSDVFRCYKMGTLTRHGVTETFIIFLRHYKDVFRTLSNMSFFVQKQLMAF